jgi:preprotein translocase subunit SecA
MFEWIHHARLRSQAHAILARADELARASGGPSLKEQTLRLKWLAKSGHSLKSLLPEAFALGIEASRRVLGKKHYPVQIMGGIAMIDGYIIEMQTGEGKTLTAVLPAMLRALPGRGCHVLTANEYLATRDAEEMGQVFRELGLSTGCVCEEMEDADRIPEYQCDITYGTATQVGFDFLRDRLKRGADPNEGPRIASAQLGAASGVVQRELYFALIDEADSILIDEAKTPLIIGLETKDAASIESLYRWSDHAARMLKAGPDFEIDDRKRLLDLTDEGCRKVILMSKPIVLDQIDMETIYQHVEKALSARYLFQRDRDYVVDDGEIAIVDEGTGRVMEGRKWQDGLHQAIEVKESVKMTAQTGSAARITVQSLFRRYEHLAGMTGTARPARRELKRVYKLPMIVVPTNKPCIRRGLPTRVFISLEAKWKAVAQSAQELVAKGRAILIGTPSVEASMGLSKILDQASVTHRVLNAYRHAEESEIVAQAGQPGRVTVSTNMAGRGTDILLENSVRQAGGLHVIATEMHTSARIDRQLVGRAARQGDPGTYQFFLSLEDELLRVLPASERTSIKASGKPDVNGEVTSRWVKKFEKTQAALEKLYTKQRKQQLEHEKQRATRYHKLRLDPFIELTD